jgi:hypothetical protein
LLPPLWPLLMLAGASAALSWERTKEVAHWLHILLAGGLSYASADLQQAKARAAHHCAEFALSGPCTKLNLPPTVPEATFGSSLTDMVKTAPALLIGAAVGGLIKLLLDWLKQRSSPPPSDAKTP